MGTREGEVARPGLGVVRRQRERRPAGVIERGAIDREGTRGIAEGGGAAEVERARGERHAAGQGVIAREGESCCTELGERPVADRAREGDVLDQRELTGASAEIDVTREGQRAGVHKVAKGEVAADHDVVDDGARRGAIGGNRAGIGAQGARTERGGAADAEGAGRERDAAREVVRAGEREGTAAELGQRALSSDGAGVGDVVGAAEGECRTVSHADIAGERPDDAAVANLQRSSRDGRAASVDIGSGQRERATT